MSRNHNGVRDVKRKLAAILFADIVCYSRMMSQNEELTLNMLSDYDVIIEDIMATYDGRIIKRTGDGIISEFDSAVSASNAAKDLQSKLDTYNQTHHNAFDLLVRIGIHLGDIVQKENDIFGDGVNVAARIEPLAIPGGICISESVFTSIQGHPEFESSPIGKISLKNIGHKHQLYDLRTGYERSKEYLKKHNIPDNRNRRRERTRIIDFSILLVAAAILFFFILVNHQQVLDLFQGESKSAPQHLEFSSEIIQNIQKLKTTDTLLRYLDEQKRDGHISLLDNHNIETCIGNWVVIADENIVYALLKFLGDKYVDPVSSQTYLNLRDPFKGKRAIWFQINE